MLQESSLDASRIEFQERTKAGMQTAMQGAGRPTRNSQVEEFSESLQHCQVMNTLYFKGSGGSVRKAAATELLNRDESHFCLQKTHFLPPKQVHFLTPSYEAPLLLASFL